MAPRTLDDAREQLRILREGAPKATDMVGERKKKNQPQSDEAEEKRPSTAKDSSGRSAITYGTKKYSGGTSADYASSDDADIPDTANDTADDTMTFRAPTGSRMLNIESSNVHGYAAKNHTGVRWHCF